MTTIEPYSTAIWINRIQGLQSCLRVIAKECADSDNPHVRRIGRQALAGVAEAERYVADREWADDGMTVAEVRAEIYEKEDGYD